MCVHSSVVSTAPKKQAQKSSGKPLTKNQRKKLKKKLKKQQEREREKEAMEGGGEERTEVSENGEKSPVSSPMTTDSCSEPVAPGNSDTITSGSVPVLVNGGNESPTATGHAVGETEGVPSEEGEGSVSEESEGEREGESGGVGGGREGGERTEEEELNTRRWGPLKGPVEVKIADLGNACWVVSGVCIIYPKNFHCCNCQGWEVHYLQMA